MHPTLHFSTYCLPEDDSTTKAGSTFKKFICSFIIAISSAFFAYHVTAQVLPAGFNQVLVANGISNPTVMTFAPDGRIFVAQQTGQLRIIKNGALLSAPFITLSVNSSGERGLLGIAFDPAFSTNNFIYLYYTLSSGANNRISRFTANGDVVVAGSELVILNLDPLSSATNHNGGTMQFGPDGKFYIGVGENANSANSQNLDTYLGKVLRINSNGTVPTGNPFTTGSNQRQRVWSYGLRNPYTITFQPGTGRLFVNDVGQNTWEEIDEATNGGLNFGWPNAEGVSTNTAYTNPVYSYMHGSGSGLGCAITGGAFFNPTSSNYPASYLGKYFYIDYCGNWIDMLTLSGSSGTRANFASTIAGSPVSIATGTDGNLYFLSRDNGAVYKITYTSSQVPVITNQPQSITVAQGNSATFSVTATGTAPLTYQWRKSSIAIAGATSSSYTIPSVTSANAGTYSVVVTNAAGSTTSNNAILTVTLPNQPPSATITTPVAGSTYTAGSVISFSGTATDPQDGTLPANAYTWYVTFHHDTHTHPGPSAPSGVTNGTFTIPATGETAANVFYRLSLVVTDSQGAKDTAFVDIAPRTSTITLNTSPQGMQVTLDGQPFTTPLTVTSVEGMLRAIGTNSPQTFNGSAYTFNSWSQGGSQTQTVATPVNNVSYTANFSTIITTTLNPVADAQVRNGSFTNTNYGSNKALSTKNTTTASGIYQSYLRFDISSLGTNSTNVKLRLYGKLNNTSIASATARVFNVTSQTWVESTINYTNKPVAQTTVLASTVITGTTSKYYEWDLTAHINSLRSSGATSVTLLVSNLTVTNNSRIVFNSKENASNKPQLVAARNTLRLIDPPKELSDIVNAKAVPASLIIYPNPAREQFTVKYASEIAGGKLSMLNLAGKVVMEVMLTQTNMQTINTSNLKDGIYILVLDSGTKKYTQRVVIKK